ncbi:MAG TPA: GNAT family N-acetyltransferase [Syntrophorhabdaceae bacterium]|nr:GNAT family N-acetyltransferase [Syntrophorhabdaceae bacterium]
MKKYGTFKITVPNDASYLTIVQLCAREVAKKFGFDEDNIKKIELGLEETFMNVIEHAFETNEENVFDIIYKQNPRGIEVIVKEQGMPFDPNRIPRYMPAKDIDTASVSGLGIYLTQKVFDKVSFHNLGPQGKETHLMKYLKSAHVTGHLTDSEMIDEKETLETLPVTTGKIDYDIRRMKPEEAIEVSRCAYKTHRYTIYDDSIYYPEQIVELNRTGMMISAVAVTKENAFMGHGALVCPYPGAKIAELSFLFVNPEYRGQGCVDKFTSFLIAIAKEQGLSGLYFFAVTNHVYSQKPMVKYGFVNCGVMLAVSRATMVFKGVDGDTSQRISNTIGFLYLKKSEILTLYPPRHHRKMIEKIYGCMKTKHNYRSPDFPEPVFKEKCSVTETIAYEKDGNAAILIYKYGPNILKETRVIVRDLCIKQIASITLVFSLEDPLTYFLTSDFERMGFFFSGILPHTIIGDALLLQYLNNVPFDYDKVQIHTDNGKDILAYIKTCDPNRG